MAKKKTVKPTMPALTFTGNVMIFARIVIVPEDRSITVGELQNDCLLGDLRGVEINATLEDADVGDIRKSLETIWTNDECETSAVKFLGEVLHRPDLQVDYYSANNA